MMPRLLTLSSSWTLFLFGNRPFSNTIETVILSLAITLIDLATFSQRDSNKEKPFRGSSYSDSRIHCGLAGFLLAAGVFTRFTFLFYCVPLGYYFLYRLFTDEKGIIQVSQESLHRLICAFFGFSIAVVLFVLCDSFYFGAIYWTLDNSPMTTRDLFHTLLSMPFEWNRLSINGSLVITPLNALLYNLDSDNLSRHGLHSRFTHLLVNMPMLFGPLCVSIVCHSCGMSSRKQNKFSVSNGRTRTRPFKITLWACFISGLLFLSMAPHQEPRFLLPFLFPLAILFGEHLFSAQSSTVFQAFWILFNLLLALFFGLFHQAGVIPSLFQVHSMIRSTMHEFNQTDHFIYYHTYMPPDYLLCMPVKDHNLLSTVDDETGEERLISFLDLKGSSKEILYLELQKFLSAKGHTSNESDIRKPAMRYGNLYLISPEIRWFSSRTFVEFPQFRVNASFFPHLSTEDPLHWPLEIGQLTLYLYHVDNIREATLETQYAR